MNIFEQYIKENKIKIDLYLDIKYHVFGSHYDIKIDPKYKFFFLDLQMTKSTVKFAKAGKDDEYVNYAPLLNAIEDPESWLYIAALHEGSMHDKDIWGDHIPSKKYILTSYYKHRNFPKSLKNPETVSIILDYWTNALEKDKRLDLYDKDIFKHFSQEDIDKNADKFNKFMDLRDEKIKQGLLK